MAITTRHTLLTTSWNAEVATLETAKQQADNRLREVAALPDLVVEQLTSQRDLLLANTGAVPARRETPALLARR